MRKWWHLLVDRLSDYMPNYELYTLKTKMKPNVCEPTALRVISIMEGTNHVWFQLFSLLITHHLSYWGPFPLFLWNKWLNPRCYMAAIQEPFALMLRWYSLLACMPRCACTCVCVSGNFWLYVFFLLLLFFILPHPSLFDRTRWPQLLWQPGNHGSCLWHSWLRLIGLAGGILPGHL